MEEPAPSPFAAASKEFFTPETPPNETEVPGLPPQARSCSLPRAKRAVLGPALSEPSLTPQKSLALSTQNSLHHAASLKRPPQLWRQSTAVTEVAAKMGYSGVADLCGPTYIPQTRLKKVKDLGEGAYAVVELAHLSPAPPGSDASTDAPHTTTSGGTTKGGSQVVAVKRLKPHVLESEEDVCSFIQEARLLIKMRHSSIVEYIGLGCADDSTPEAQWRTMYLVQEYARTGTLKKLILDQMISPGKKLYSLQDAVRWGKEMAQGLAFLHHSNPMIIHRDLKTENVLLTHGQGGLLHCKLADFGLHTLVKMPGKAQWSFGDVKEEEESYHVSNQAALQLQASSADGSGSPDGQQGTGSRSSQGVQPHPAQMQHAKYQLTGRTGAFIYMAPEVYLGKPYNEKVDVFGLGIILFELLHRKMILADIMYVGTPDDVEQYAFQVAAGMRLPISEALPQGLRSLIKDCLADSPDLRPSMPEIVERLEAVLESGELQAVEHTHGPAAKAGCCTIM